MEFCRILARFRLVLLHSSSLLRREACSTTNTHLRPPPSFTAVRRERRGPVCFVLHASAEVRGCEATTRRHVLSATVVGTHPSSSSPSRSLQPPVVAKDVNEDDDDDDDDDDCGGGDDGEW